MLNLRYTFDDSKQKQVHMKNFILFLIFSIAYSSFSQNKNEFSLYGKTKGIKDGTYLLLQNPQIKKFIDSAKVNNNTFVFNTEFTEFPIKMILWRDRYTPKTIWLENKKMSFDASNTNFEDAIVIGSVTDSLATILRNKTKELKTYEDVIAGELDFIKNHPNNLLSAHNLSIMAPVFGKEKSTTLYMSFSDDNKQSFYGKKISEFLGMEIPKTPQIGERYIDFSMNNQRGEIEKLSSLEGNVILLEFWASWCLPCRKENPELVKSYNKFKKIGFEIFAVSLDKTKENWVNAIKKDGLNWKHVSDLKGRDNIASYIYGINEIPDNILIDKNGIIIGRNLRGEELNKKLMELMLAANKVNKK